jgi:hypothetical protein
MVAGEILLGILGKAAYDIIKGIGKEVLSEEDEDLFNRLYRSIEIASRRFFERYANEFGIPPVLFWLGSKILIL